MLTASPDSSSYYPYSRGISITWICVPSISSARMIINCEVQYTSISSLFPLTTRQSRCNSYYYYNNPYSYYRYYNINLYRSSDILLTNGVFPLND